jgi:mannobiose 2-epimerase
MASSVLLAFARAVALGDRLRSLGLIVFAAIATAMSPIARSDELLTAAANKLDRQLRNLALPFWLRETVDGEHGGFQLEPDTKQLVGQSRMVWGFSHAHRHGLATPNQDYLSAARQGFEFLQAKFHDRQNGGYVWLTDRQGNVQNGYKMMYGQAFVIYAFVEYYRASRDPAALDAARNEFRILQSKARDTQHGGWYEHFTASWEPVLEPGPNVSVEVPGLKSSNTYLHLMEAFTELYRETHDAEVGEALRECLQTNKTWFYPPDPAQASLHRQPDGSAVDRPQSAGLSYGHNVEFAWLMLRAEEALGMPPSWSHFYAYLDHALEYGFDTDQGGLYSSGHASQPASNREKVWWAQAELLAALTVALQHQRNDRYANVLRQLDEFLHRQLIDPRDGIWIASVDRTGKPRWDAKFNHWKANYHDLRAIVMFQQAFGSRP